MKLEWNDHHALAGAHSFLSASKHSWVNYDEPHLLQYFDSQQAAQRGTLLHDFAHRAIVMGIHLPRTHKTLNMFVNDALGYHMQSEQVLFYSMNAFGTTDAISYKVRQPNNKLNLLRVHDLKTGVGKCSMDQLYIYAAYFFLEYDISVEETQTILRIYQNDDIIEEEADPGHTRDIMGKIISFDKLIEQRKKETEWKF